MLNLVDLSSFPPQVPIYLLLAFLGSAFLNVWLLVSKRSFLPLVDEQKLQKRGLTGHPAGWWASETFFQAERRSIFSKTWICVSHRGRFAKPGDYVTHELAGFRFFIIRGKDDQIRTFHNICRHRAFPVANKATGSAMVLGCQYHGWSYNTKGELTKAPQFDNVPGFDKGKNSLFEIHTKVDGSGFIHINLAGDQSPVDNRPPNAEKIGRPARISPTSQFIHGWEMEGNYNWKAAGNPQSLISVAPRIINNLKYIDSQGNGDDVHNPSQETSGIFPRALFTHSLTPAGQLRFFPLTTVYTKSGRPFWYQITLSPASASSTTLRCGLYSTKQSEISQIGEIKATLEAELKHTIQRYEDVYRKALSQDATVGNLTANGAKIANTVSKHLKQEEVEGSEIKPATVQHYRSAAHLKAEQTATNWIGDQLRTSQPLVH
ncbi:unnamed protein product [Clonostachys solani]|uniref:Rieske domain-containing protein n=1 Tax=Clonostachys solani TaxID=160281 RepID=A0A9N9ZF48_9HYPO|nr:unnamed protein product [Clonostachys solani]